MEQSKINPFALFPKEIWELILGQVEDSKDIVTVLREIPKLDISINSKKRFWYIGQVLPFIYTRISQDEALNLRLVCKEWMRRMDHFLQNQPYYRAYSEDLHKDNLNFLGFLSEIDIRGAYKCVDTNEAEFCPSIMDKWMDLSQKRNPFVFRELNFRISGGGDREFRELNKTFAFLEKFGSHLWYLGIDMELPLANLEFFNLVHILKQVQNLKCLALSGNEFDGPCHSGRLNLQFMKLELPQLPFFETFKLSEGDGVYTDEFLAIFLNRYGPQIRRLCMPLHRWKVEFKNIFPQLTELELEVEGCLIGKINLPEKMILLRSLLNSISAPKLVCLRIIFLNDENEKVTIGIDKDVFKWLSRFPQIKYFEIFPVQTNKGQIALTEDELESVECIPSLETLKIVNSHGLSYNFLRSFLFLRNLEIRPCIYPHVEHFSIPNSNLKLREQIQTGKMYESNIWDVLPKLNKIVLQTLLKSGAPHRLQFDRESFDKLKKAGRIFSGLYPFRQDILEFLEEKAFDFDNKGSNEGSDDVALDGDLSD